MKGANTSGTSSDLLRGEIAKYIGNEEKGEGIGITLGVFGTILLKVLESLEGSSTEELHIISQYTETLESLQSEIESYLISLEQFRGPLSDIKNKLQEERDIYDSKESAHYFSGKHNDFILQIDTILATLDFISLMKNTGISSIIDMLKELHPEENLSTKEDRIKKLRNVSKNISELKSSVSYIGRTLSDFLYSIKSILEESHTTIQEAQRKLTENEGNNSNILSMLLGLSGGDMENFSHVFHRDLLTTSLFDDIFIEASRAHSEKDKVDLEDTIHCIFPVFQLLGDKKILPPFMKENIEKLFVILKEIEGPFIKIMELFEKQGEEKSPFILSLGREEKTQRKKVLDTEETHEVIQDISRLADGFLGKENVFDKEVEKFRGDTELCALKKKAFDLIDAMFHRLEADEEIDRDIEKLLELCKQFKDLYDKKFGYKPKNKKTPEKTETRFHYVLTKDEHDKISGVKEQSVTLPSPSIGKSIAQVKAKILHLLKKEDMTGNFRKLFPGKDNSLENILILGPYGTGKTALIRELAYDASVVTIAVQSSELLSMWYGVAEQNPKKMFEQAQKLHIKTGKQVLIMIDEFDQLMNLSSSRSGNQGESIQKEMQVLLDGVTDYPGVHLVGLSNEPEAIPPAIIRRMDTVITEKLSPEEKTTLISSKFGDFEMDQGLIEFLKQIGRDIDYSSLESKVLMWYTLYKRDTENPKNFPHLSPIEKSELYWEYVTEVGLEIDFEELEQDSFTENPKIISLSPEEKEVYRYILMSTPKILSSICQRAFDKALEEKEAIVGEVEMRRINSKLGKYKSEKGRKKFLSTLDMSVNFQNFFEAAREVFKNPTILRQIQKNEEFYAYLKSIGLVSLDEIDTQ